MFERESPFNLWMCLPRTLRVALPKTRVPARCPGNGFTPPRRDSTPRLPANVFTPCPAGELTNDQSTKQRGKNGPFGHQGAIVPDSLDPVSQGSPRDSHVG